MKKIGTLSTISLNYKSLGMLVLFVVFSNFVTYQFSNPTITNNNNNLKLSDNKSNSNFYLMNEAQSYVYDAAAFEKKVKSVARNLNIAPEWLMAIMHAESRFDASAINKKGGGTAGLIQFNAVTTENMGVSLEKFRNLNHLQQLEYIERYFASIQNNYRPFQSVTDIYIAILYPEALNEDYCYSLYSDPETGYVTHSGLDEDKDGRITLQDVDRFLKRIYPTACSSQKPAPTVFRTMFGF